MDVLVLAQEEAIGAGFVLIFGLFYLALVAFFIVSAWKLFVKAGEEGWKVLVPFYNVYTFLQIVGRPGWWVLLYFIPIANIVVQIIVAIDVAKSFGKDTAYAIGLIFLAPIFYPILAFGEARYLGPAGPEPRPGYPSIGQGGYGGGYGGQGYYGAPQGGYQPPPGQNWGQPPQQQQPPPQGQQWGQPPQQPQGQQWGQPPQQPQWGQQPSDQGWGQPPQPDRPSGESYPPPPV